MQSASANTLDDKKLHAVLGVISNFILSDTTAPKSPTLTTPASAVATNGTMELEVNGEVGAKVYANGVQVGTIGNNGKSTIELSFVNGVNNISLTLKDNSANESEALTFSVSYDAPPVITINGDLHLMLTKGDAYIEAGATAEDANDGTVSVNISGTVDTDTVGDYNITYNAIDNNGNRAIRIREVAVLPASAIVQTFPMDIVNVEGHGETTDPDKLIGIVRNQFWIQAFQRLTEEELRQIVAEYNGLTILGYSDTHGLLIQISENNIEALSALQAIKLEKNIENVRNRIYIGNNILKTNNFIPPNDNSKFDDDGDNWHLEYINILNAWEITTGSNKVAVGIVDGGIYRKHEDINIKASNTITTIKNDHGTGVASVIGAKTNNEKGISGINWVSPLVVTHFQEENGDDVSTDIVMKNIFEKSEDKDIIRVVNNSYGPDPKPLADILEYATKKYDVLKKYRDKLFVFSAGNEHNNSMYTMGALHLVTKKENITNDNILIVAALLKDGTLPYYSNYGETVDIAAPSEIKAAKDIDYVENFAEYGYWQPIFESAYGTDNDFARGAFDGTSAAAPVVTGVASLIYSLNPNFTPEEVKNILIKSCTKFVTKRHKKSGYAVISAYNPFIDTIEPIPGNHPIPILDAGAALKMAKEYVNAKKVDLVHYYPSVFSSSCNVHVKSVSSAFVLNSVSLSVEGRKYLSDVWENISIQPPILSILDNSTYEIGFAGDSLYAEYKVFGTVTYDGLPTIEVNTRFENTITEMNLKIEDKIANKEVNDTTVLMEYTGSLEFKKNPSESQLSLDNGRTLYIEKDQGYKIHVTKDGYKDYGSRIGYFSKTGTQLYIGLAPEGTDASGSLYGRVTDEDGKSITNAYATLKGYGDTITTQLVKTGTSGIYRMSDLPILDTNGEFIEYELNISRLGYKSQSEVIALVDGKSVSENFILEKDPSYTFGSELNNKILIEPNEWNAEIQIGTLVENQKSAIIDFGIFDCGGDLTYLYIYEGGYLFDETITYGSCLPKCQIWIKFDGSEYKETCNSGIHVGILEEKNILHSSSKIKKTGQTISYINYDDGYYQKGVAPQYTRDNTYGIVTDHVTGLEWQDNESEKKPWLTWLNNTGNYDNRSGDTATTYCNNLTLYGRGWRLPTIKELLYIVDNTKVHPSINSQFKNFNFYSYYWSSTTYASDIRFAWYIGFESGDLFRGDKTKSKDVRCVRAGQ